MMTRYDSYKKSGLVGVEEIPQHWEVMKLKYAVTFNDEVLGDKTDDNYEIEYVEISNVQASKGIISTEIMPFRDAPSRARRLVKHGDVIVSTVRTYLRAISKIESPPPNMVVSTGFAVIRPIAIEYRFAGHLFTSEYIIDEIIARSVGVSYPAINASELVNIKVALPPYDEQLLIANYLDVKTAHINMLIQKKQRLISLLEEEKTSVINEAVTKGLNPDVPMKDSGIAWLGEVPAHWEVRKVSRSFSTIGSGTTPESGNPMYHENGTIPWVNTGDLNDGVLTTANKKITEHAFDRYSLTVYPAGSLIIAMYGATIGKVAILDFEACTNQACCVLGESPVFLTKFAYYFFLANKQHIVSLGYGGGQPNISQELIKGLKIPAPNLEEQSQIVSYLERETSRIEKMKQKFKEEISLIQEYRTALISEAVTGKIDVRDYQPELITSTAFA